MSQKILRIGTRESPLAVWQATQVQVLLHNAGVKTELVYIKSEGDKDLITPLYAIGVQGIFTKALDAALLNNRIDVAVHSMKDVPVQLAEGIAQAAVLKRGNWKDILVYKDETEIEKLETLIIKHQTSNVNNQTSNDNEQFTSYDSRFTIATGSIRRIAQWLNYFPHHKIENLRGNVNTRLQKLEASNWNGAIFAAAGLERINLRPEKSIELNWMLPAPAQGAIMVVCRTDDNYALEKCMSFNDENTALCTMIERDFLDALKGGCSTPIGALAEKHSDKIQFAGNILTPDGKEKADISFYALKEETDKIGKEAAEKILKRGGQSILDKLRNAAK